MDFNAAAQNVLYQVLASFGEATGITYLPASGPSYSVSNFDGSPLTGVFDAAYEFVETNSMTGVSTTRPVCLVRLIDLQAAPAKGDQVTIRSQNYKVIKTEPDGRGGALLILQL